MTPATYVRCLDQELVDADAWTGDATMEIVAATDRGHRADATGSRLYDVDPRPQPR